MKTNLYTAVFGMDWPIKRRGSNEKTQKPSKKELLHAKADRKNGQNAIHSEPFTLNMRIESPPLVAYGPPDRSSGALLSGILDLYPLAMSNPTDKTFDIGKLEMKLVMNVNTHRPIGNNCPECACRSKILHTWVFVPSPLTLAYNNGAPHGFPFSFLLPGNLPATTRSSLATVTYTLQAEATPVSRPPSPSANPRSPSPKRFADNVKPIILTHPLKLSRSILPAEIPRHSHRVFPPTTLTATTCLPTVIYPGSMDAELELQISGLNIHENRLRWSVRKISWRVDELAKVVSPACHQHASKIGGLEGKGILYEDARIVGAGDMKSGWKRDESEGKIEAILRIGTVAAARAACNVDAMSGVHVSHNLVIECVVAEEMLHSAMGPAKKGGQYQPTGNARVLRMVFPITVTEHAGMGISWDEEIPPRYEDVAWNAPPSFAQIERERRDSTDEIEALEGIRRPRVARESEQRPSSSGSFGAGMARSDSGTSDASG